MFGDPWIELGSGPYAWGPLSEGDPIELVAGPQGGWHLDTALWFDGFGPDGVTLVYDAVTPQADSLSFTTQATLMSSNVLPADEGWHRLGDRVVLDIQDPSEVVGTEVVLRVTASLEGQSWSDTRQVLVVDEAP